eukprot:364787-Chlamydomonas_euryale.AAC.27
MGGWMDGWVGEWVGGWMRACMVGERTRMGVPTDCVWHAGEGAREREVWASFPPPPATPTINTASFPIVPFDAHTDSYSRHSQFKQFNLPLTTTCCVACSTSFAPMNPPPFPKP